MHSGGATNQSPKDLIFVTGTGRSAIRWTRITAVTIAIVIAIAIIRSRSSSSIIVIIIIIIMITIIIIIIWRRWSYDGSQGCRISTWGSRMRGRSR